MKNILFLFYFILLFSSGNYAQDKYVLDSLNNVIDTTQSDLTKTKYLIELSTYYWYINTDSCILYVNEALKIINKKNADDENFQKELANAENSLGVSNYIKGAYPLALKHFENSNSIAISIKDSTRIASSQNNIGHIYSRLNQYDNAISSYQSAYDFFIKENEMNKAAVALQNIGNIHSKQDDYEKAYNNYKKCIEIFDSLKDIQRLAIANYNVGLSLFNLDSMDLAEASFTETKKIADSLNNILLSGSISMSLGEIHLKKGRTSLALKSFKESRKKLLKLNALSRIYNVYKGLSQTYEKMNKIDSAFYYFKKFYALQDSLSTEETIDEIATLRSKFNYEREIFADSIIHEKETQEQQIKIRSQKEQIKKDSQIQFILGVGVFIFLILAVVAYKAYSQKNKANEIIKNQKAIVEEKNKEITDSIKYAKRIQAAILPPYKVIEEHLPNSFILYKPKDIVAGDFYWLEHTKDIVLFAAADCTGHGVPGAMVSVICNNGLNRSVREHKLTDPGKILDKTKAIVTQEFEKSEEEVKDGMDIALCSISNNVLKYAGANNPLWLIRNNEIIETKANKQPIGKFDHSVPFNTHETQLIKGDTIYIFSDGYPDQFGGDRGKKFKSSNFKKLLLSIQNESMKKQKQILNQAFEDWKGNFEQIDDVCVIGVKIT